MKEFEREDGVGGGGGLSYSFEVEMTFKWEPF